MFHCRPFRSIVRMPGATAKCWWHEIAPKLVFFFIFTFGLQKTLDRIFGYDPTLDLYTTAVIIFGAAAIAIVEAQALAVAAMDIDCESQLPFPGKVIDGKHKVEYLSMYVLHLLRFGNCPVAILYSKTLTLSQLKSLCSEHRLPISGNKATLTVRLETFSADQSNWDRYLFLFCLQCFDAKFSL